MSEGESGMMISVIIPIYNTDIDKLKRCLNSILEQTFGSFEILIVDDGNSEEYVSRLNLLEQLDPRITVLHKKNGGVSVARNFGTLNAKGDYVVYIDGDDIVPRQRFAQTVQAASESGADVLIGKVSQIDESRTDIPEAVSDSSAKADYAVLSDKERSDFVRQILIKHVGRWGRDENNYLFNGEGCWSYAVRRQAALAHPFPEGISIGEDTIWGVKLMKSSAGLKICTVDALWYYYIQYNDSVLHRYNPRFSAEIAKAVRVLNDLLLSSDESEKQAYFEWIQYKQKQIIYMCYLNQERNASLRSMKKTYSAENQSSPWKEVFCCSGKLPLKTKIKFYAYSSGNMLLIQYLKNKVKSR